MFNLLFAKITLFLPVFAAFGDKCSLDKKAAFVGIPPWWKYIKEGERDALGTCQPALNLENRPYEAWSIGLAILDMMLVLAGILAVIFIIIAGINFIVSQGNPDEARKARMRMVNALVGVAIVFVAIAFVNFIGNQIGK